jgi:hypothetical protein
MAGNRQAQASAETPVAPAPVVEAAPVKPQGKGKTHGKVRS